MIQRVRHPADVVTRPRLRGWANLAARRDYSALNRRSYLQTNPSSTAPEIFQSSTSSAILLLIIRRVSADLWKFLEFRSFQSVQTTSKTSESSPFLNCRGAYCLALGHHSISELFAPGVRCCRLHRCRAECQTSRARTQPTARWSEVSSSWSQRG
jgi:hypothetical protein